MQQQPYPPSTMKNADPVADTTGTQGQSVAGVSESDEEDPWITRIKRSGCFSEHEAMQDCYYDKKDWRQCREAMAAFRLCFAKNNQHQILSQASPQS
ncbi:hypothetical protein BASA50_003696 [Batrachochytrium salamandrivorans]|uniref:CHCH domain-containing protein n=1 Tax=Batrachochytrium salamandrivorans TaxID=1357716 RepID=A0ABQ8FIL2_9FUNG|nr:hypothetical protein BASA60_007348 [Batrachochytrium salamandrivorans]KAH6598661.1 hypothetical protein BASA50_003696 [Batrachochytrium salamandrivorans]KAH9249413.1 hypothetical protein BASA81_012860 [Batrachochytrium salamandrivorans]KAJ1334649.1 hypothetical protein BSLG_007804 [Batrachochytrium salamandrivorans]